MWLSSVEFRPSMAQASSTGPAASASVPLSSPMPFFTRYTTLQKSDCNVYILVPNRRAELLNEFLETSHLP